MCLAEDGYSNNEKRCQAHRRGRGEEWNRGWSGLSAVRHFRTSPAFVLKLSQPSIRLIMKHIRWCNNSHSWTTSKAPFQSSFIHALNESENSWRFSALSHHEWEFHKIKNLFAFCFPFNHLQNVFRARAAARELRWEPVDGWSAGICLKLMSHGWWGRLTAVKYLSKLSRKTREGINV